MIAANKFIKLIYLIAFTFLFTTWCYAVEVRGKASESVDKTWNKKKTIEAIERARVKACRNAFDNYIRDPEKMPESKRMIFESIQDQIYNNLNEYMVCTHMVEPLDVTKYLKEEKAEIKLTKKVQQKKKKNKK